MNVTPGWQALFERAGLSPAEARRAALSRRMRDAALAFLLPLLPANLKRPAFCVDLGANWGEWSSAALTLFPGVPLHAFEPDPDSAKELLKRVGSDPHFVFHPQAVGSTPGVAQFHRYGKSYGVMNSLTRLDPEFVKFYDTPYEGAIQVEVARLDDVLPETLPHPLFVKIDVQGAEAAAIDGGRRVFRSVDIVLVEILFVPFYEGDADFWALHRRITEEFDLVLFNIGNLHRAPTGGLLWGDAIYVRPDPSVGEVPIGGSIFLPSLRLTDF